MQKELIVRNNIVFETCNLTKPENFLVRNRNKRERMPGFIEGLAYDTAMIAFRAASNQDVHSQKDIKDRLKETRDYDGATALTSFKSNGDVNNKLYVLQISGHDFVELN